MRLRTLAFVLALLGTSAVAAADGTWYFNVNYNYAFDTSMSGDVASFGDLELKMDTRAVDDSYAVATTTGGYPVSYPEGTAFNFYNTAFLGPKAARPTLVDSILLGVLTDSVQTQHLVLFMDPTAAANVSGTPYDGVFATSAQPYQYTEDQVIGALTDLHGGGAPQHQSADYTLIERFEDAVARQANVGTNGTKGDAWFRAGSGFSIVEFSDGKVVGSGTATENATFVPSTTPEPASLAALGVGAVALLRRRRR